MFSQCFFFCTEGRFCPLFYCLAEFINLVSSESNEVCSREEKRTIAPEHVLKALEVLTHPIDLSLIVLFVVVCSIFLVVNFP
jgi:ATP/ADP translocase